MNLIQKMAGLLLCGMVVACAPSQLFPAKVSEGVDPQFDFTAWRMAPNGKVGHKVQLGGRIIQAESKPEGVVIVAAQLPIVNTPAYGPKDTGKRSGEYAVFLAGKMDPKWLAVGNHLAVIGTTTQARIVVLDDIQRSLPSLTAQCVHIWKTGGKEISEFPFNTGGGYEPLEENTDCASER